MKSSLFQFFSIACAFALAATVFGSPVVAQDSSGSTPAGIHQSLGGAPQMHQDSEVRQAGWPSIPLPKITLPKMTMPKVSMPSMSTITKPVKVSFSKISSGTKKAWEGTKELFSFGGSKAAQSNSQGGGFWQRIFVSEPEQPSGPQTVGEWMAQPRLDP